jgi:Transposase, Mutator family
MRFRWRRVPGWMTVKNIAADTTAVRWSPRSGRCSRVRRATARASSRRRCLGPYQRSANALGSALAKTYIQSVWTCEAKEMTETLCGQRFLAPLVREMNRMLDAALTAFATLRLQQPCPCLILHARYERVCEGGVIASLPAGPGEGRRAGGVPTSGRSQTGYDFTSDSGMPEKVAASGKSRFQLVPRSVLTFHPAGMAVVEKLSVIALPRPIEAAPYG